MARRGLKPNLENCNLRELETASNCSPSLRGHRRMLAMKFLSIGVSHEEVAEGFSISKKTLYRWIKRFNEHGIDGLIEGFRSGRPRKICAEESEYYKELIENPELSGETHWTGRKFHGYLKDELFKEVGYRTVIRWLHENDFRLKVPRPWPEGQNEEARQAFIERLRGLLKDPDIDLWYLDETGIEGDPRPRRRWIKKGIKGRIPYKGEHIRMTATGMICPRTGQFYTLEFTHSDSTVFQIFLDHANKDIKLERKRNLLICDNATWHKKKSLDWNNFEPVFLPPYSPDLNPIERLWLIIKAEWFTDFIAKDRNELVERLDRALLWAINRKIDNKKTCAI